MEQLYQYKNNKQIVLLGIKAGALLTATTKTPTFCGSVEEVELG